MGFFDFLKDDPEKIADKLQNEISEIETKMTLLERGSQINGIIEKDWQQKKNEYEKLQKKLVKLKDNLKKISGSYSLPKTAEIKDSDGFTVGFGEYRKELK